MTKDELQASLWNIRARQDNYRAMVMAQEEQDAYNRLKAEAVAMATRVAASAITASTGIYAAALGSTPSTPRCKYCSSSLRSDRCDSCGAPR